MPLSEALSRGSGDAPEAAAAGDDGMNDGEEMSDDDGGGGDVPSSSPASTAAEAKKLAQCADVLDWCLAEGSAAADSLRGKYASEAEWRVAVSRRRAAVSGVGGSVGSGGVKISSTFLDALRARAAGSSSSSSTSSTPASVEYPPAPTPRAAAPAIFMSGGASPSALSAKLDLFAYCLADAGEEFFSFFF